MHNIISFDSNKVWFEFKDGDIKKLSEISHDRYFINKFADETIEFKDGKVERYIGGYDDYKEKKGNKNELCNQVKI